MIAIAHNNFFASIEAIVAGNARIVNRAMVHIMATAKSSAPPTCHCEWRKNAPFAMTTPVKGLGVAIGSHSFIPRRGEQRQNIQCRRKSRQRTNAQNERTIGVQLAPNV